MRILHIIQRYWPARGGAETHLGEISARLAEEGHDVVVATTDALDFELFWDPSRRRVRELEDRHRGVRIRRFPVRHLPVSSLMYPALRRVLYLLSVCRGVPVRVLLRLSRYTPWVPALWRWLERTDEPFDLVAGMTIAFEPLLEAGLRFARRRGIPFVVYPLTHLGAGPRPGIDPLSRFYTMRHQVALVQASDGVVAQTPTERQFYTRRAIPEDAVLIAGPGVNPAEVSGGDGQRFRDRHGLEGPLIAFLSAMSHDKGTVHLVEAMRQLWRTGRQVQLVLAGTPLKEFRRYLEGVPEQDREHMRLLGYVQEDEKKDLLAAADVLAVPSRTDSFGIVYLEAWVYRKPVIAARTWGVNDVVDDGRDGLLVPFGDVDALAQAVSYLLDHPAERNALGLRGEEKVYQYHNWNRKYGLVVDFYRRLTDGNPLG